MTVAIKRSEILYPVKFDWIYAGDLFPGCVTQEVDGFHCELVDGSDVNVYQDDILLFASPPPADPNRLTADFKPVRVVTLEEYVSTLREIGYIETVTDFMSI